MAIEFENVSFAYNKGAEKVIDSISFKVNQGERFGIIGGTGSGKSTLVSLMTYEHAADSGAVQIMGERIENISEKRLHELISYVPQKATLISGTISENITMGKNLTDDEMRAACDIAQISSHIESLPEKYDAPVMRDGKNFSGGQRQRLSIARAVAGKSDILILDDSTSALDFTTERNLRRALNASLPKTSIIIISQRISSIKHCDKILVMDDGKAKGIGTHKELFTHCDAYRDICMHQLSSAELEELANEQ